MTTPTAADGTPVVQTQRSCLRKKQFDNEAGAWSAIFRMRARNQDTERLNPYACAFCSHWHLGRLPSRLACASSVREEWDRKRPGDKTP